MLAPFLGPPPGYALTRLAGFVAGMAGMGGVIGAYVGYFETGFSLEVSLIVLAVGVAASVASVTLFVNAKRIRQRQDRLAVRLAGQRLTAEWPDEYEWGDEGLDQWEERGEDAAAPHR